MFHEKFHRQQKLKDNLLEKNVEGEHREWSSVNLSCFIDH